MKRERVLIAGLIRQRPTILKEFLKSIKNVNRETVILDYLFIDDNDDPASIALLDKFDRDDAKVIIEKGLEEETEKYIINEDTHYWTYSLIEKLIAYKNAIMGYAYEEEYDYIFFIDSDLIIHPNLIEHLKSRGKDVVSEIFWTRWHKGSRELPNAWLFNTYDFANPRNTNAQQREREADAFLNMLRKPGIYEVGGLGACTLISRAALDRGVSFSPIKNIALGGEDRFFCIRAAVLGIELFIDTCHPAYHIYREEMLDGLQSYVKENFQ